MIVTVYEPAIKPRPLFGEARACRLKNLMSASFDDPVF
jgi:hypothetical protein